jgi:hypothetical protein
MMDQIRSSARALTSPIKRVLHGEVLRIVVNADGSPCSARGRYCSPRFNR